MKALLCTQFGLPETLVLQDLPELQPAPGEVVIDVFAASANFPDTLIIQNKYKFKPTLPFSPGGEVAGTIAALGEGVSGFALGDRVIGVCGWGGFAEQVRVPAAKLQHLPAGVPMDLGAALIITYGTTHYALVERAQLQPGETLLVLGAAGGTGLSAIELGKLMGARVIAAASSDDKLALCRQHGADETINYATEDLRTRLRALTNGRGVDVVYDPVGGAYSEPALRSMAWKGRFLVIGFTTGEIPKVALNLTLLKGCSIVGVFYGAFSVQEPARHQALMDELLGWLAAGRIKPLVTAHYPLELAARGLRDLLDRRATGKIVITTARGRAAAGG